MRSASAESDAVEALIKLLSGVCEPAFCDRCKELVRTEKGRAKFLALFAHKFSYKQTHAIRFDGYQQQLAASGFVFKEGRGQAFGEPTRSIAESVDALSLEDCWLIVAADGSVGVFQPESYSDERVVLRLG